MEPDDWPDPAKFLAARTAPLRDPNADWLRTVLGRLLSRFPRMRTLDARLAHPAYFTEYREQTNCIPFWLLPARTFEGWWSHVSSAFPFGYREWCLNGAIDRPHFDRVFDLFRTVRPSAAGLELYGHADKPRRNKPHVELSLDRDWAGLWSVTVCIAPVHPQRQPDHVGDDLAEAVRAGLGRVDEENVTENAHWSWIFKRLGVADPDEAYQWFHSALAASVPYPGAWSVSQFLMLKDWPTWIETLNAFRPAWSFVPDMLYSKSIDPLKRPTKIDPARPVRYPLIAWNPGSPPRLQVDLIHAAAGSWLECQTLRGRDWLDEVSGLVGKLEVWEGPPETRWCD